MIPAILSRATPVLTILGSWTTPNNTTVSNSPEEKRKLIQTTAINSGNMTLKGSLLKSNTIVALTLYTDVSKTEYIETVLVKALAAN